MKTIFTTVVVLLFFVGFAWAEGVQVEELIKSTSSWNDVSLPDYSQAETEVTVLKITVDPQTSLPMHFHPVINVAYMLTGELTVISDQGKRKIIKQGEALIELVNQDHYGINEGVEPVEILVVYLGEKGQPITVKK